MAVNTHTSSVESAPLTQEVAVDKLTIAFGYDGNFTHNSGVSSYALTVGNYMASQGHDVHYFVAQADIDRSDVHVLTRTVAIPSNGSMYPQALPANRSAVREQFDAVRPDVIHSQLPFQPLVSGQGINHVGPEVAKVGTFHTLAETPVSKAYTWLMSRSNRKQLLDFDATFCATSPLQDQVRRYYGVKATLLPLPVDVENLSSGKRIPEYNDDKLNLGFIGRLDPRKGCHHLIGALSLLDRDTRNHVRLLIAGEGPLRASIESAVIEHKLEDTVNLLGNIPPEAKPDFLATTDIAMFPATQGESFGLVLAEAMAGTQGVVVGGDNPGYRSALGHQEEVLFDPTSLHGTADFIKNLVHNEILRNKIRSRQQELVKNYDISVIGPVIEETYRQALRARKEKRT